MCDALRGLPDSSILSLQRACLQPGSRLRFGRASIDMSRASNIDEAKTLRRKVSPLLCDAMVVCCCDEAGGDGNRRATARQ